MSVWNILQKQDLVPLKQVKGDMLYIIKFYVTNYVTGSALILFFISSDKCFLNLISSENAVL